MISTGSGEKGDCYDNSQRRNKMVIKKRFWILVDVLFIAVWVSVGMTCEHFKLIAYPQLWMLLGATLLGGYAICVLRFVE